MQSHKWYLFKLVEKMCFSRKHLKYNVCLSNSNKNYKATKKNIFYGGILNYTCTFIIYFHGVFIVLKEHWGNSSSDG